MSLFVTFFPISIFELARKSNSARYSLQIWSNLNQICISYVARNSISARNSMSLFVTFFPISIFELARNSNSARYSLQIGSNWNRISISYLARNSISARNSMSLFVTFFPISIFELARNSNSARYSLQIGSYWNQICISYVARNSISARNSMSLFATFSSNIDLRAGSKFKLSSIFASDRIILEPNIYFLCSSKFNFSSRFNVNICNFFLNFDLRSSSQLHAPESGYLFACQVFTQWYLQVKFS